ncbi:MAG: glycoside hydrolase family 130 protein [Fimbriimonadaceae bacterium]|nr:glycoside hydrolase family 130 protein [Fimbriimonadaceae bacterium]
MSSIRIVGPNLPNIPWEPKPDRALQGPMWRYSKNPIIPRDLIPTSNSIFNSAAVPFRGKFAGVFRCDNIRREMVLHAGKSDDGIAWSIAPDPIQWVRDDQEVEPPGYAYDPRVCHLDGKYWVTWCNGFHGPTIGLGYTEDFETFHMVENALLPYNRNGVLFPRKVNGRYLLLSRPSDTGHTAFGDIYLSQSEDLIYWGRHRYVMGPREPWESTKIGAGPVPIETTEGWLLFHHGVLTSCNGYVYSFGAVLLDLEKPWIVRTRCRPYLINPRELYELAGDVPNVTFPCAALADAATGRITIYYGCADTVTGLAFCEIGELYDYMEANRA